MVMRWTDDARKMVRDCGYSQTPNQAAGTPGRSNLSVEEEIQGLH